MTGRLVSRVVLNRAAAAAMFLAVAPGLTPVASAATQQRCKAGITATFGHGPDAGLSLVGTVTISISASGQITGELKHRGEGKPVRVAGSLRNDRLLGLSFDLHGGLRVFATGKSFHVVRACNDLPSSGKTHGPRPGDSGQWFKAFWTEA